jgi:hypothetical protein
MKAKMLGSIVVAILVSGVLASTPAAAAEADLSTRNFQTPSGNINCHIQKSGPLRCDIYSGLKPEPNRPCELDWVGLLLEREGQARPNCAGDTVPNQDPPVLQYGDHWQRWGRRCVSRTSGLSCHNFGGWHFKLSRDDWDRWYTQ